MAVETVADAIASPCLVTASEPYWRAYLRGYTDGCAVGYETHRAEIEAADDVLWAEAVRRVHAVAKSSSYATLCERRGEPERVARARAHERRLGLAS